MRRCESTGGVVVKRSISEIDEMLPGDEYLNRVTDLLLINSCACTRRATTRLDWGQSRVLPTLFWQLPRASTMASTSQRPEGCDRAPPALDAIIQVLSLAKDSNGIPHAQAVVGVASAILTTIRVRFSPLCDGRFLSRNRPGFVGQQTGFCGFWAGVRQ